MSPLMLITGASRGIGAATALLAAQAGYRVILHFAHNGQAADAIKERIQEKGGEAHCLQADFTNNQDIERMFAYIQENFGPLRVLINNAGILETQGRFDSTSQDRWQRIFQVNVMATMLCSQLAVRQMSTLYGGQGGTIVNVSSLASVTGSPNEYVDYAASKGAVDSFSKGLAKEVAAENIRVNVVRPGFIYTEMHADGGEPDRVDRLAPQIPMQRGGQPEEVARAILWLAGEEASYTSGTFLDVAGGR